MMISFEKKNIRKVFVFDHKIPRSQKSFVFCCCKSTCESSVFMRVAFLARSEGRVNATQDLLKGKKGKMSHIMRSLTIDAMETIPKKKKK